MAAAIPAWEQAAAMTHRERQALSRGLVARVVVHVPRDRDAVPVAIPGAGVALRHHAGMRPGQTDAPRRDVETRLRRMREWRTGGATPAPMATTRHGAGGVPPTRERPCSHALVGHRLDTPGVCDERRVPAPRAESARGARVSSGLHPPHAAASCGRGRQERTMAARRFSQQQQRRRAWRAADERRTGGVIARSPQTLVGALPGAQGPIRQRLRTREARGLLVIGRARGLSRRDLGRATRGGPRCRQW